LGAASRSSTGVRSCRSSSWPSDLGELVAAVCEHVGDEVTGTSRDVEHD
jgi:hypothetical protein